MGILEEMAKRQEKYWAVSEVTNIITFNSYSVGSSESPKKRILRALNEAYQSAEVGSVREKVLRDAMKPYERALLREKLLE